MLHFLLAVVLLKPILGQQPNCEREHEVPFGLPEGLASASAVMALIFLFISFLGSALRKRISLNSILSELLNLSPETVLYLFLAFCKKWLYVTILLLSFL